MIEFIIIINYFAIIGVEVKLLLEILFLKFIAKIIVVIFKNFMIITFIAEVTIILTYLIINLVAFARYFSKDFLIIIVKVNYFKPNSIIIIEIVLIVNFIIKLLVTIIVIISFLNFN